MAILWQKQVNGTRYEVRSAGATRRLYTDGVFHSQYNPNKPLSGGIWDLLMLPVFFAKPENIKRVLVLGVGGGTVIHQLKRYVQPEEIVGIDLNPVHLQVARTFFGINKSIAELHQADAVKWLQQYDGPPFDLIIEDLFGEQDGEPLRAVEPSAKWFNLMSRNLTRNGILVMNFIGASGLRRSAYFTHETVRRKFKSVFQFTLPLYENVIGAFLKQAGDGRCLQRRICDTPGLNSQSALKQLNFRLRKIAGQ